MIRRLSSHLGDSVSALVDGQLDADATALVSADRAFAAVADLVHVVPDVVGVGSLLD